MLPKESPRSKAHKIVEPKKKSTRHVKSRSLGEPFTEEEEAELSYHMLENDDPFHYLATWMLIDSLSSYSPSRHFACYFLVAPHLTDLLDLILNL